MKKIALTFGIIICTYIVCFSQNDCHESYTKILGSLIDSERGYSIAGNEAEKILYVGGLKNDSVIIIKVTTNGEIVWARTFDVIKGSPDHINGLLIDSEGKLCVAGTSTSALPAGSAFVFRYDPDLNSVLWAIKLSNSSVTTTLGIIEMGPGGNYLLSANPSNPNNAELNELDRNTGAVQNNFSKEYDLGNAETFQDLFFYNNNIYACGRFTDGDAFERMRSTLVKLDPSDGSIDWITLGHRPKNVDARLYNVDLVIAQQKIYSVTVGDEDGGSVDFTNIFIQRTSLNGDVEWIKKVDLPGTNDWADEIIATENGFVVMCRNRVPPSDIILFKFDSSGNLIWSRKYDFSANDNSITLGGISSQLIELDHHFYFTAFAQSSGSEDMIVVKTDLNGEISDTCQVSKPVDVVFTDVVNPVFYTVTPETENSDPDITSLTIIPRTTNINVRNVCAQPASIVSEINQTICEGEQFEGYTTQGMYIDTFITNGGCDSVRTLHLSVASCPAACGSSTTGIFGITGEELRGYSLAASPSNDGFYLAGLKEDSVLIVKADLAGQILWSRTFDIVPNLAEHVYAILVDSDGMLAVAGTVGDPSINSSVFAFRYNPNTKQVLWVKEYFSDPICFNFSMIEKGPGGNYLLTNSYFQTVVSNNDSELLEIDKNTGSIIPTFSNHYHLGSSETIYDLVYYKNFLYGVGRYTDGPDEGDMRNTLIKLNPADGSKVWSKMGHRPKNVTARLYGVDLVIDQDNIYSVCHGDPSGTSVTNTKLYIQKTDLEGNLIWLKQYELAGSTDAGYSIIKSGTGFVVIAGVKLTNELALFKIDTDGNVLWARNFIFPENLIPKTYFNVVGVTSLIEVGQSLLFTSYMSNAIKGSKLLLIKTDLEGKSNIPCVDNQPLSIPVQTISNPIFYSVEPIVVTYNPLEIIHTVSGVISGISPSEGCFTSDTIFSEINATICEGMQYEGHTIQGTYIDTFTTSKGCDSLRTLHLSVNSIIRSTIHKEICSGQTFEGFDHTGVFRDTFQLISGCDSIRTLHLTILTCDPVVTYDLDACKSNMLDGSNMIYTEFTPQYPTTVSCGNFAATTLQRAVFPDNKHSCTPGVNGSIGMCVNSLNSCTYVPGNPVSVFFEVEINPETDSTIAFNKLEFYAKGPANYVWVNGPTGPNNYPRFYGIRILKNNVEIFQKHDLPTSLTWSLQSFNFNDLEEFKVSTPTTFRIELLPYCPINNGAEV
ncbi:MAG: hypothetical protein ABJC12_00755, partial [Saprospiraceae bacterium]